MVPSHFFEILVAAKTQGVDILLFGDQNQCHAVEDKWYVYHECNLVKQLCDYNFIKLQYKEGFARYNIELHDVLDYFLKTGKLHGTLKHKKVDMDCWFHITRTNAERRPISQKMLEKFDGVYSENKKWKIGVPVMCYSRNDNDSRLLKNLEVYNSQMFSLRKYNSNTVVLEYCDYAGKTVDIPTPLFEKYFELGFAVTVYKYQGSTINEPFSIHETHRMTKQEMYTALSRGRRLEDVHFDYTDRRFILAVPKKDAKLINISVENEMYKKGKIYRITDGDQYYIGSTCKELKERFSEHKDKPVNKNMQQLLEKEARIELVKDYPCSSKTELESEENKTIASYVKMGFTVINVKQPIKLKEPVIQIVQQKEIKPPKVIDDGVRLRVSWMDEITKKHMRKDFKYSKCGKNEAQMKIDSLLKSLLEKSTSLA